MILAPPAVVEGTACGTGQEFFRSLVRHTEPWLAFAGWLVR
jgi:hypothetical protein